MLFRFPQTDLEEGKLRPALLPGKLPGEYDDWLICMICSQTRHYIPKVPGYRGKITRACNYLKEKYNLQPVPIYEDCLKQLFTNIRKVKHYNFVEKEVNLQPFLNLSGIGLFTVYKIRNDFMHGSLNFSEPGEWQNYAPDDHKIILTSTRIILLSIQMLLISFFKGQALTITKYEDHNEIDLENYLFNLHLVKESDDEQLKLELFID